MLEVVACGVVVAAKIEGLVGDEGWDILVALFRGHVGRLAGHNGSWMNLTKLCERSRTGLIDNLSKRNPVIVSNQLASRFDVLIGLDWSR